ncbi:MAG: Na/Pi cotransporter family protein [Firmicutes bacterium]|nr:Na/Pi cotransporter family protein [Bacillota bacterium]
MDIFDLFTLIGGLAFFLYGMNIMGNGLETLSGSKLQGILEKMTSSPLKGVLLGTIVTAIIQSSSATTVMVVGFVNSGIMQLTQAVGVIMGANIGTTATAWILSLTSLQGDSFLMQIVKPANFTPILAMIGVIMTMMTSTKNPNSHKKDIGLILIGFAILIFGMDLMSSAVEPLSESPEFANLMTMFTNPILGMLVGLGITAIIQSSSATSGILQALSTTGQMSYGAAMPIIMGTNIGTCVTALISSVGAKKNAKRAAFIHLYFNVIGSVLFMVVFYTLRMFITFGFETNAIDPTGIAIIHSLFNIATTAILLPFNKLLVKLAAKTVRDNEEEQTSEIQILDERLFATPTVAIERAREVTCDLAQVSAAALKRAIGMLSDYQEQDVEVIRKMEDQTDIYEDRLGTYLVHLSSLKLSNQGSHEISKMLHSISDFERIGDHSVNVLETAAEIHQKGVSFSVEGSGELQIVASAVMEIVDMTVSAFTQGDYSLAMKVEPLEQVIDKLCDQLKLRHIERLKKGNCTIEQGFIFTDLLTNYERVADHCSNIAGGMIQIHEDSYQVHEYLNQVKENSGDFAKEYELFKNKYSLN